MPLLFMNMEAYMARKSRYMAYAEGLSKNSKKKEERSTPKSILKKLKELKEQNVVITVPAGAENE
ncbi:hypothetical protein UYO_2558 [Lachnospiraceae bacterium JC7]|nr:hypothetical protein UYO_2558 [Lachnospiraceae bacterium JC7]